MTSSQTSVQPTRRFAALALTGASMFAGIELLLHVIRPEYDIMTRFLSEYAVTDPLVAAVAGIALGLGSLALAKAMESLPREQQSRFGSVLLKIFGICAIGIGVFPTDEFPTVNPPSWHGLIHAIFALIGSFAFSIGSLIISWRLYRIPVWRKIAVPLMALAALCLIFFFLFYAELPIVGLVERIFIALILLWIGIFSQALSHRAGSGHSFI